MQVPSGAMIPNMCASRQYFPAIHERNSTISKPLKIVRRPSQVPGAATCAVPHDNQKSYTILFKGSRIPSRAKRERGLQRERVPSVRYMSSCINQFVPKWGADLNHAYY